MVATTNAAVLRDRSEDPIALRTPILVVGWSLLLTPFVIEAVAVIRANRSWIIDRLPDDAFYYLEVARRLGRGQGATFDGLHETTGYHPLWQWLLVPLSWVAPGSSTFIKVALLAALALTLMAVLLVVRVVWRLAGAGPALVGGIVAVHGPSAMRPWVNGMEGAVVLLTLALLLTSIVWWADSPEQDRRAFVVGLAGAAAVLARLDLVIVIPLVPAAMAVRARSWRPAAMWVLGCSIVGIPFLGWFATRYHQVLTTSALVKQQEIGASIRQSYGGRLSSAYAGYLRRLTVDYLGRVLRSANATPVPADSLLAQVTGWTMTALGLAGAAIALVQRRRDHPATTDGRRAPLGPAAWGLAVVTALLAVKAGFDLINAPLWAFRWYSAPQRLALPFAIGSFSYVTVAFLLRRWRAAGILALAVLALACLPLDPGRLVSSASDHRADRGWQDQLDLASRWIATEGPPGRYGAPDAGLLGYRLDREVDVVNLDGLVNDYRFADWVTSGTSMLERAERTGVRYFVGRWPDAPPDGEFGCATTLWTSPHAISFAAGVAGTPDDAYVYVFDLQGCQGR